jgi:isopentenyl-diphosphate delta-isomerase
MTHLCENDELLDLVDRNDQVIGVLERSQVYAQQRNNFRVINCFISNDVGQLWIPRRTAHKRLCPLALDVSVGGHVASGETYDAAFAREFYEEVGLRVEQVNYKKLGALNPHEHGVSAFMQVYQIFYNQTPPFNHEDFIEYYWLYPHEVLEKIAQGDKAKSDLPLLIQHFFDKQNKTC